jgi:type IV pilus assembly protein PilB
MLAVEAALTGHIVFSTIHTNSAAGTVQRLINMDIEPFLIASALKMVISQRL